MTPTGHPSAGATRRRSPSRSSFSHIFVYSSAVKPAASSIAESLSTKAAEPLGEAAANGRLADPHQANETIVLSRDGFQLLQVGGPCIGGVYT